MNTALRLFIMAGCCFALGRQTLGEAPSLVHYQGRLISGTNLVNGAVSLSLRLFDQSAAGQLLYEDSNTVTVADGLYSTFLGDDTVAGTLAGALSNAVVYLETVINGVPLAPRERVASVPFALRVAADGIDGVIADGNIPASIARLDAPEQVFTGAVTFNNASNQYSGNFEGNFSGTFTGDGTHIYYVKVEAPLALKSANSNLLEATGGVINSENTDPGYPSNNYYAKAFHGFATASGNTANIGGWFGAAGDIGYGVYGVGWSETTSTKNFGGYFEARAGQGRGVYAEAKGGNGRAVEGVASKTGSYGNYGGYFTAAGNSGVGVYGAAAGNNMAAAVKGEASNTGLTTINYGGYFKANGGNGVSVYGEATSVDGTMNYGGKFIARGSQAKAVYGEASTGTDGTTWGGFFTSAGSSGMGVEGTVSGASGTGVRGVAEGASGVGVFGWATASGTGTAKGGQFISQATQGIGVSASGNTYDFYATGAGVNYGPITGGHEVRLAPGFPADIKAGQIVSATGQAEVRLNAKGDASVSSTLPTVRLADRVKDKAVFGVLVAEGALPEDHWHQVREGERFATVNALGEGRVWVTDAGGDIEAGDYITTSSLPGYGQRQDDDLLHAYSLGKATETVDWAAVEETVEYEGRTYKVYLLAVVYVSG